MGLDFLVTKGPLVPSNSTICPKHGPKRRQKAPKNAQCAPTPRNQERAVSWAAWLKTEFQGHLVHPQPPTFGGFQASDSPNETPRPPYQWSLGAAVGPASPRTVGANGGFTRVPGAKKMIFSKVVPRPLGMLKQVFSGRLEPVVTCFGPWKMPECLENGPLWDQKWVQNGLKTRFFKSDPRPFWMHKQVFLAHFEPVVMHFGPWKIATIEKSGVIKPSVHAVSARFRKTRRYTKVVCCVLHLCTRVFHRRVRGDQTVHAVSGRFRKTRRYTKVVCCVLHLCTRVFHQKVRGDPTVHAVSARFRKTRRYTKVACCVLPCALGSFIKRSGVIEPSML